MDPLEEPEVLLMENRKQKTKLCNKTQTRQSSNETKKKTQGKKIQDKLVKSEPSDDYSRLKEATKDKISNEIEVNI